MNFETVRRKPSATLNSSTKLDRNSCLVQTGARETAKFAFLTAQRTARRTAGKAAEQGGEAKLAQTS